MQEFIRNLWRWAAGRPELPIETIGRLKDLPLHLEWSPEFERYMRNRLQVGAFRYGPIGAEKPQWDRVESICKRIKEYRRTGNLELLVDVANLALLEFVEGRHPNRHWSATDDGDHVRVV